MIGNRLCLDITSLPLFDCQTHFFLPLSLSLRDLRERCGEAAIFTARNKLSLPIYDPLLKSESGIRQDISVSLSLSDLFHPITSPAPCLSPSHRNAAMETRLGAVDELYLVLASSSSHESRMLGTLEGRRGDDKHLSKSSKNHSFDVTLMIRASETNARRGERSGEKSGER